MAIFHFTVKIVGRSKGKSIIAASAYLNGDVMKNEETGKVSYYTSKKEVVYTSLMMCENAPPEWMDVSDENIKRNVKINCGRLNGKRNMHSRIRRKWRYRLKSRYSTKGVGIATVERISR